MHTRNEQILFMAAGLIFCISGIATVVTVILTGAGWMYSPRVLHAIMRYRLLEASVAVMVTATLILARFSERMPFDTPRERNGFFLVASIVLLIYGVAGAAAALAHMSVGVALDMRGAIEILAAIVSLATGIVGLHRRLMHGWPYVLPPRLQLHRR